MAIEFVVVAICTALLAFLSSDIEVSIIRALHTSSAILIGNRSRLRTLHTTAFLQIEYTVLQTRQASLSAHIEIIGQVALDTS